MVSISTIELSLYSINFVKGLLTFILFNLILDASGQQVININGQNFFPYGIGTSNGNTKNANHADGAALQDYKKSVVFILKLDGSASCSGNLLNCVNKDKKILISTAAYCSNLSTGETGELYLSFNYEMENSSKRGGGITSTFTRNDEDDYISLVHKVTYKVLFKNYYGDQILIEILNPHAELLNNVYAAGWDNTLSDDVFALEGHPTGDHKKVYIHPEKIEAGYKSSIGYKKELINGNLNFYYSIFDKWNNVFVVPEEGTSGSGLVTKSNLVKATVKGGVSPYTYFSHISYSWWGDFSNSWWSYFFFKNRSFGAFLDPNQTWLNKISGGYLNDLQPISSTEDFSIELPPETSFNTASVKSDNPKKLR